MKQFIYLILFIPILFFASSCDEETKKDSGADYIIFSEYHGFCNGPTCINTYKLEDGSLFEDQLIKRTLSEDYDFIQLPSEDFDLAKIVLDNLPDSLLIESTDFIGCPDCADQGGIYIEYMKDDELHKWRIDVSVNALPNYLKSFIPELIVLFDNLEESSRARSTCDEFVKIGRSLYDNETNDALVIQSAVIDGDCLNITFSASGCDGSTWDYHLIDANEVAESIPEQRRIRMSLDNDEECLSIVTKELSIDIRDLKVIANEVILNLEGYSGRLLYQY